MCRVFVIITIITAVGGRLALGSRFIIVFKLDNVRLKYIVNARNENYRLDTNSE